MRIVKIVPPIKLNNHWVYRADDTIEITDAQLDEIGLDYRKYSRKLAETYKPLSQYLNELIELRMLK